jgi:Terminase RNaseH-like domain/Terminase large subunit, T4likevirus-type, N-terminal
MRYLDFKDIDKDWEIIQGNVGDQCYFANGIVSKNTSISWLILDEYAFVPETQATEFFESVYPTISSGKESKISIFSTPKGMNHFYKMWVEAIEKRSEFIPVEIKWDDVPGRDQKWKEKTISNIGQEAWDQEFEAQFLGSSNSLINAATLKRLVHTTPKIENDIYSVYKQPVKDRIYMLTVDCARGGGGDYTVGQMSDITTSPFEQVAVLRSNTLNSVLLPRTLTEFAKKYNDAFMLLEINDIGESVADNIIYEEEYENLLSTGEKKGKISLGSWSNSKNGLRTTKSTKRHGCANLKLLVENNKYIINDFETIKELSTFVAKAGSYEADEQKHDDTVMALVVMAWASSQEYFKELCSVDFKTRYIEEKTEEILDDLSPIGYFDGLEEQTEWEKV